MSNARKTRHSFTQCLRSQGWERDDAPADEVGECTDISGCSRVGRWTHPYRTGMYCAQHVHADNCVKR